MNGVINYQNQGLSEKGKDVGRVSEKYSILQVCIGGSIGKCAVNTMDVTYNQQINAITPILSNFLYIYYLMDSKFFLLNMRNMATGTATPMDQKCLGDFTCSPSTISRTKTYRNQDRRVNSLCRKIRWCPF